MVGGRRNTGGTNVPPSIETLSAPATHGFVPPKKPDRIYDQCDADPSTVAVETNLETLRQDTENSEVYNIVIEITRDPHFHTGSTDSDDIYVHLRRALETPRTKIAQPVQTSTTGKPAAKPGVKVGSGAPLRYNGLNDNLAPLSDINEIFDSITTQAMSLGLEEAMEEFVDDEAGIRIVTMCSGTESPIIAMNMVQQALQRQGKSHFKVRHLGSCEIEPYKQAFIERNFGPPVLFRDVTEFTEHNAHPDDPDKRPRTAYGATAEIPEGVHILIAGSSCVDHSSLNNHANKVDGESAQTLLGVADYADRYRPVIVLLENVATADWQDQHIFWAKRNYYFRAVKVDSKNYYIPQTRERGYSFAIDKLRLRKLVETGEFCNPDCTCAKCGKSRDDQVKRFCEDVYNEWARCMSDFQRRASSPYTEFLLKEDDARLQVAKAMTENTKPNKQSSDWNKCQKRHTRVRAEDLLGTKRPFTNREGNGRSDLSDFGWQHWVRGQTLREQDVLDISALRYVSKRDLDMRVKSRNIDISQNVDRDTDTRAWGLVGCITPKGTLFDTRRGGPIVGLEVLALQGMPIDNLDLTKASLRQLQDLAGNAMTTTVIGASILSTLIACHRKFSPAHSEKETLFREYTDMYLGRDVDKVGALGYEYVPFKEFSDLKGSGGLEKLRIDPPAGSLWQTIIADARISQRLCLCESLGQHTTAVIKHCRKCFYTCCENCTRSPHDEFEKLVVQHEDRGATDDFISNLTQYLPGVLSFSLSSADRYFEISKTDVQTEDVDILNHALENELRFQGVKYEETWKAIYESQTARLELEFVRETQQQSKDPTSNLHFPHCLGVRPVWLLFAKCPAETAAKDDLRNWLKHPIARMYPRSTCFDGVWEFWKGYKKGLNVNIKSVGALKAAWEAKLGLQGHFYPKLQIFNQLEVGFDGPQLADADAKTLKQVAGTYTLLEECPAPFGWLYVRDIMGETRDDPVFFYLNSDPVHEAFDDRMQFRTHAPNLTSDDNRNLLFSLEGRYLPTTTEADATPETKTVKGRLASRWIAVDGVSIQPEDTSAEFYVQPKSSVFTHFKNCEQSPSTVLLAKMAFREEFCQFPEDKAIKLQLENKPGVLKHFKWMVGSVARIPELSENWHQMSNPFDGTRCFTCVPRAPTLQWVELEMEDDKKKQSKQKLVENAESAKDYEQAMKQRPVPVSAVIHRKQGEVCLQIQINVLALMHRAAAELAPAGGNMRLEWRLLRHPPFAARPKFDSLKLLSNSSLEPALSAEGGKGLWLSQRKTLAWMTEMEEGQPTWNEEILKETCIPSLGWRLEAKASRNPGIRGGVLADKVGAGKTTTTLELVRQDLEKLQQNTMRSFPHDHLETHLSTDATLILVPNNLMNQWEATIRLVMSKSFLKPQYLVLKNAKELASTTIANIRSASILLAPLSLFEDEKYWEHHRMVACAPNVPEKAGRAFDEYLDDSLSNLASITKAFSNGSNEPAFWREWSEARGHVGNYIRFSGVKTRASKKAQSAKARTNTTTAGSQKRTQSASQDSGNSPPRKKAKAAITTTTTSAQASKVANTTASSAAKKEWVLVSDDAFEMGEKVRFDEDAAAFEKNGVIIPVLHMFNFRRLIVDEFTYAQAITLAALLRMKATSRWLLSGTPPIHDYDSVNTMGKLLGTKLSVVDEMDGVHSFMRGLSRDSKLKSLSEEFQEHQGIGSPAFIKYLYGRAHEFSETFIRQDECSEPKKGKRHELCSFRGSISERLDYADLNQTLETEDCRFNVKIDPKKLKGMTTKEIRQELRQSRSGPRAALVCSMSDLASSEELSGKPTTNDPRQIANAEQHKVLENCAILLHELRQLWYCKQNTYADYSKESFDAFLANLNNLAVLDLDPSVVPIVDYLVSYAETHPQQPASTLDPPKKMTAKAEKENKVYQNDIAAAEMAQNAFKMLLPTYQAKDMDERTTKAERLVEEIVVGLRRLRFIRIAKDVYQGKPLGKCSHCGSDVGASDNAEVSAGCGHIIHCSNCTAPSPTAADMCMDKYCAAFIGYKWSAGFFARDPDAVPSSQITVTRMRKAVDIINAVPDGQEFVLVFVQYRNMAEQFVDACEESGIKYADATDSKQSSKTIEKFREDAEAATKKGAKKAAKNVAKVLLLQIDSEDAAGWNLQCANHVIFLAPVVGESEVHEWDTMVQAVGRAHRPGQKNDVRVYHIYAADTTEKEMATTVKERFEKAE